MATNEYPSTTNFQPQVFYDAIHGFMEFPPLCVDILNTIQFHRLRNIKQLGMAYYVYPSASHNRFEHCLGTCHLAGKLIRHLKQQNEALITERDVLCVEIAGLCHDLGHGPFSHVFEKCIKQFEKEKQPKWHHEKASCEMFTHLLDKNSVIKDELSTDEIELIKDLIAGDVKERKTKKFLFEIINNKRNNVDVDKWDYLARDSHYLGIGISFDHNRMIKMSKVIKDEICYRDKTLDNFYDMFYSRYRLHKNVYQHKTVLLFGELLVEALIAADGELHFFRDVNDMEKFTYFTDSIFEMILRIENDNLKVAQDILKEIIHRSHTYKGRVEDGSEPGPEEIDCKGKFNLKAGEKDLFKEITFYEKDMSIVDDPKQFEKQLLLPPTFEHTITHRFKRHLKNM